MRYDPERAPVPSEWLEADESERLDAVLRSHRKDAGRPGSARLHAAFHVMAETQIAEGLAATVRAMERLLEQGLDRHDALHAIGSVAAEQVYGALKDNAFDPEAYDKKLDDLTAEGWLRSADEA